MSYFPVEVNNDYPGKGKGVIEVARVGDKTYILLAGSDRYGTIAAVEIFKKLGYIPGTPMLVDWNDGDPIIVEV